METKSILSILLISAVIIAPSVGQFCTADAKLCPDGSFVGRDPENDCEFRACPEEPAPTTTTNEPTTTTGCGSDECVNPNTQLCASTVQCFVDPCSINNGGCNSTQTCTANFCGGCNAVCEDIDICELSAESGLCLAYFPSYFFNSNTGVCEQFIYGGCGGNGNRFSTEKECMDSCGKIGEIIADYPDLQCISFLLKTAISGDEVLPLCEKYGYKIAGEKYHHPNAAELNGCNSDYYWIADYPQKVDVATNQMVQCDAKTDEDCLCRYQLHTESGQTAKAFMPCSKMLSDCIVCKYE